MKHIDMSAIIIEKCQFLRKAPVIYYNNRKNTRVISGEVHPQNTRQIIPDKTIIEDNNIPNDLKAYFYLTREKFRTDSEVYNNMKEDKTETLVEIVNALSDREKVQRR